jgi:hypothetical protein
VTVLSTATRVRAGTAGQLTAECCSCRVHLEQLPGTDVERALAAFDEQHPPRRSGHGSTLPWGWRPARAAPAGLVNSAQNGYASHLG